MILLDFRKTPPGFRQQERCVRNQAESTGFSDQTPYGLFQSSYFGSLKEYADKSQIEKEH
jgi:hypothetical protein